MSITRAELDRHEQMLQTLLRGWRELAAIQAQHSQAILELAAALREAGVGGVDSPFVPDPASQNANIPLFERRPGGSIVRINP